MPPLAATWDDIVTALVLERGSLAEVARSLKERLAGADVDLATIERGLRRLRKRGHDPADKYGRWVLRHFGLPPRLSEWARALGTYHGPLIDLPLPLRRQQLRSWDLPPTIDAAEASWIHLAVASLRYQDGDPDAADRRLELAELGLTRAGPEARIEWSLFGARRAMDRHDAEAATRILASIEPLLDGMEQGDERACFTARWLDQRAYVGSRGWRSDPRVLEEARALIEQIPDAGPPFVQYRRHHGLAWVHWRQGERGHAIGAARSAIRVAGDAGLRRLRAASLRLLAQFGPEAERDTLASRARAILAALDG